MNNVVAVTFDDFERLLEAAQEIHNAKNEPIPNLLNENSERVKSILSAIFYTGGGRFLYKGFYKKAAILFFLLIKNHPLQNGNKRMAILTLAYFCYKNGRQLKLSNKQLYTLSKKTAMSTNKDKAVARIRKILLKNTHKRKKNLPTLLVSFS